MSCVHVRSVYVCYDIADPKRLRHVAKEMKTSGLRVQKSVFECSLNSDQMKALRHRLVKLTDQAYDKMMYQPVCPYCRAATRWQGKQPGPEFQPYWVV